MAEAGEEAAVLVSALEGCRVVAVREGEVSPSRRLGNSFELKRVWAF